MTWGLATIPPWTESDIERCRDGFIYGKRDYSMSHRYHPPVDYRLTYCPYHPPFHTYWFRTFDAARVFTPKPEVTP